MKTIRWTILPIAAVFAASACHDAAAPSAALVMKLAGDSQSGFPGDTMPRPVQVRVSNTNGGIGAGVTVRFVASNASVFPDSVQTDASGEAAAHVVLGMLPVFSSGVRAYIGSSLVSFTMTVKNPCDYPSGLSIGAAVSGTISERDCALNDGTFLDAYSLRLDSTSRIHLSMSAAAPLDPFLFVIDTTGWTDATNNNNDTTTHDAAVDVLLPAGRYIVWANTLLRGQLGPYQLTSSAGSTDIPDCAVTFVRNGVTASETLPAGACPGPTGASSVADHYRLVAIQGDTIAVTASAAGFPAAIRIYQNSQVADSAAAAAAGEAVTATYVVPGGLYGSFVIEVGAAGGGSAGGAYTVAFGRRSPAAAGLRSAVRPGSLRAAGVRLIRE